MVFSRSLRWPFLALFLLGLSVGCHSRPAIETYTIAKDSPDRMLGAILLEPDRSWFFKLTAPRNQLSQLDATFEEFLQSLQFARGENRPSWKLPSGWREDPQPNKDRVATLKVPLPATDSDKKSSADLTVTVLQRSPGTSDEEYLLANINRWRGQMGQGRVLASDLDDIEKIKTPAGNVVLVNIVGHQKASGMAPPFAGSR